MSVCIKEDEFTQEKFLSEARWTALLSNGEQVISDDGRPGATASAWLRLGDYVRERGLKIKTVWFTFRNEPPVRLPDDCQGYFFCKRVGAFLRTETNFSFFMVGYLKDGVVRVKRYKVPEMTFVSEESRTPEESGLSLIRNY